MERFGLCLVLIVIAGCYGAPTTDEEDRIRLDQIANLYGQGDTTRAIVELEEYLATFPGDSIAWTILGHALEDEGRPDEAQIAYESALKINPRQFEAITGLGIVHRGRGNYDAAMTCYERALEIDQGYAQAYTSMATIALKKNEDARALVYAKIGYDIDKTDPVIAANLAIAYHYNDDYENRDKLTRIAEQLGYDNTDGLQGLYSGEFSIRD